MNTTHKTPQPARAASNESDPETQPPSLIVGRFAHIVIGDVLDAGLRTVEPKIIAKAVRALPLRDVPSVHPYAVAQQLSVCAAVYLRLFLPDARWKLHGREVKAGRCRFDLVFISGESFFVDQIKTGRLDGQLERETLDAQTQRELTAGTRAWPDRFIGVRTVILGAPRKSAFFSVDGSSKPIEWGPTSGV